MPPLKWDYPFNAVKPDERVNAQTYFTALSLAEDGFFPMGANGLWHGGIHFGQGTAGALDQQSGGRAMASGEVVAYRLNSKYPQLTYPDKNQAMYSSGFVLIRHRMTMPRAPVADTAPRTEAPTSTSDGRAVSVNRNSADGPVSSAQTATPSPQPADETLTFFTLYMHVMDWAGYQAADAKQRVTPGNDGAKAAGPAVKPMPYWQGRKTFRVIPAKTVNNRQQQPPKRTSAGEASTAHAVLADDPLGAFIANDCKVPAAAVPTTPIDPETVYTGDGIAIRRHASSRQSPASNAAIVGILPLGAEISISRDAETPGWGYIGEVLTGKIYPPKAGEVVDPAAKTGCVFYRDMQALTVPTPLDQTVVLDTPWRVEAGDVVGYLGEFQRYRDAQPMPPTPKRPQMHLEMFAGDEFKAFFEKSKQRAKHLSDAEKTILLIASGAKLIAEREPDRHCNDAVLLKPVPGKSDGGRWAYVQPMTVTSPPRSTRGQHRTRSQTHGTPYGSPVWVERTLSGKVIEANSRTPVWQTFPLSLSHAGTAEMGFETAMPRGMLEKSAATAVDDQGKRWWYVGFANAKGQADGGWVCEAGHPKTAWVSPFAWPGFELIDYTSVSLVEQFKRFLFLKNQTLPGEDLSAFAPSVAAVNGSHLLDRLAKAIDVHGDNNGKVSADELRRAMAKPWLARAISRLVVRFESEWGGDMRKWHALDDLFGTGRFVWQTELERIEKLQFWKDVAAKGVEGFPAMDEVYHFHPVGMVENFEIPRCKDDCIEKFEKIVSIILKHEGGYVNNPSDRGGATNRGISWPIWQRYAKLDLGVDPTIENLRMLTEEKAKIIYYKRFWQPKGFCDFDNESVALMVYDWTITSNFAVREIQRMLNEKYLANLTEDNILGSGTIAKINTASTNKEMLLRIGEARKSYYHSLVHRNQSQGIFLNGWINRVNDCLSVKLK